MKAISSFAFYIVWAYGSYSQTAAGGQTAAAQLEKMNLSYTPSGILNNISVSAGKINKDEYILEFTLNVKQRNKPPSINAASIVLIDNARGELVLNNPSGDSAWYNRDGQLNITVYQKLTNEQLHYLKTKIVEQMKLTVDNRQLILRLSRKTKLRLKEMINTVM